MFYVNDNPIILKVLAYFWEQEQSKGRFELLQFKLHTKQPLLKLTVGDLMSLLIYCL
ncbi:hypothetical protein SDC9_209664 [bioreactor metagenome]|uniref:Uncharacterized protein n=1 Tax=bioreactor metagenome TaxID=1076179 RepID=A0A645JDW8_9ZZZZ